MVEQHDVLDSRRKALKKRRRLILLGSLGVFCLIIALLVLFQCTDLIIRIAEDVQSSPQANEWAMFRRDLFHTGNAGTNVTSPEGTLKWTFATGGPVHSSPAVTDEAVYFGSRDGNIYALDSDTGEKLWAFKTESWVESSPVVVGGVVYCGSNDGTLYALDAKTGAKRWAFATTYSIRSTPAVADGVVYIGCDDYNIYAVDAETGIELWRGYTGEKVSSSPAVAKGIVLAGSVDGLLYSFNAKNGNARLQFDTKFPVYVSPAIKDGVAYFANNGGVLCAVDIMAKNWWLENKLKVYWNTLYVYGVAPKPPNSSGFLWSVSLGWRLRTVSSPTIVDNYAYLGASKDLVAVDLTTHEVQWRFTTGGDVVSSPAAAGAVVYVGSEDGHLYAINRATGEKLWDVVTGDQITSSPAVNEGMIYIGSMDGKLYAFE